MTDFFAKDPQTPDLSSISLLVCTPCGDGKYESSYMESMFATSKEIERLGGQVKLAKFPYCADLSLARAKLMGSFYRSEHTHLMWIDADMGWRAQDVVRLFLYGRDFIGAAGPKKKYPLEFAANLADDYGNPLPVLQEGTGLIETREIGMAFMLLSRACVERLWQAHPELEFDSTDNTTERALFEPMITNRRRFSEDYALCRRWRDLGGKIYLAPDIILQHTGSHTFSGALEDSFEDTLEIPNSTL